MKPCKSPPGSTSFTNVLNTHGLGCLPRGSSVVVPSCTCPVCCSGILDTAREATTFEPLSGAGATSEQVSEAGVVNRRTESLRDP